MAPARLSMPLDPIYRGSTWRLPVQFLNEDQTPFDLTGAVATAFMERNGLPRQRVEVVGNVEGSGLVTFNGDETETGTWAAGRYGIEIRLAIGDDVLSVLVATIPVVKGPADGGTDAVLPGAAQTGGVQGVVVSATGMIRAVIVDRVRIGGGGSAGEVTVPQELADLFGGSTNLADVLSYIAANMGSAPSPILQTLAGNIVSQAVLSGMLSVAAAQQILLTGALSSTTGLTGSLSVGVAGSVALVGTAISTSTASGALSLVAQVALTGAVAATSAGGGTLTVAAGGEAIGGTLVGQPGAAGTLVEGYTLATGDDFVTEPTIFRTADIDGQYKTSSPTRGRRSNNDEALQYYWDKHHWGFEKGDFYKAPGVNPFSVSSSVLAITAASAPTDIRALHDPDWPTPQNYSSGFLATSESFQYRYGVLEVRAKMPLGNAGWAAIWTMSNELPWPGGAETGWEFKGNGNYRPYFVNEAAELPLGLDSNDVNTTDGFHTFAMRWFLNAGVPTIQYYVDGVFKAQLTGATPGQMDRTRYLILNLALSTNWNGDGGVNPAQFPSKVEVDWWRYWKPSAAPTVTAVAADQSYNATRGTAFSQVIPTLFSGNDSETVVAVWAETTTPGAGDPPGNIALPAGMTWTAGTRTIAWDNPIGAGRMILRFVGWNTAGGVAEIRHITLNLPPKLESGGSFSLPAVAGVPFDIAIPLGNVFDCGNVAPTGVTATQTDGSALPAWVTWNYATRHLAGTSPTAGTLTVRFTCTSPTGSVSYDASLITTAAVTAFTDDFNRTNRNLEDNAVWTRVGSTVGAINITSNQAYVNTTDAIGTAYLSPDLGQAIKYAQCTFVTSGPASFLAVRITDANNYIGVRWSANVIQVYQRVAGALTLLASYNNTFLASKVLRLEDHGTFFKVFAGGVQQTPASGSEAITAGPPASTRTGFIARTAGGAWFDNYEAGVPSA